MFAASRSYQRGIFNRPEQHKRTESGAAPKTSLQAGTALQLSRGSFAESFNITIYGFCREETSVSPSESRLQTKRTRLFSLKYKIADKTATLSLRDCQWTTRTYCLSALVRYVRRLSCGVIVTHYSHDCVQTVGCWGPVSGERGVRCVRDWCERVQSQ